MNRMGFSKSLQKPDRLDATMAILSVIESSDAPVVWAIFALVGGILIGAVLVRVMMQRRWVEPVRQMMRSAEQMSAGQWQTRADVDGAVEVNRLGQGLNRIARQADLQLAAIRAQTGILRRLVDALPDPILLTDANDRIVMINAPAARLLQLPADRVTGKKFVTAVNEFELMSLYETVRNRSEKESFHRDMRFLREGVRLSFQAVAQATDEAGMLIVLRDISTLASTIQMKTDFVANASHELRTPISAIKVAFDTLKDVHHEDPAIADRCISIIGGHLKRLEDMLADLLDLSRVERAELKPHISPVRVDDVFALVRSNWDTPARSKGVSLTFAVHPSAAEMTSDRRLLDLVLKNLVENAIKFTPAGGSVTVVFEQRPDSARIAVSDTGAGIPADHLDRVFERFYQVEAARTGSAGRGTGLGLAIVKHAVHALSGEIQIQSEVGKGTTVACILPTLAEAESA
jgi:two-component system, OmpR family, phosphate regulon sensor histidine kinase PhoR